MLVVAVKKGLISDITGAAQAAFDDPDSFTGSLPSDARPYADLILQVAQEKGIDPYLIAAIGHNESRWGLALTPQGPNGTSADGQDRGLMQLNRRVYGDDVAWYDPLTAIRLGADHILRSQGFFTGKGTIAGTTDGTTVSIGATSAAKRGVAPGEYPDPRPLEGELLTRAVVAAYNTGDGNVLMSVAAGKDPDTTTTSGVYASSALNTALQWAKSFFS